MEVKDFSEKIVKTARNGEDRIVGDYLGNILGMTSGTISYFLNNDSLFSNPFFHFSGLASGATSYIVQKISERGIKPKLHKHTSDERFKRYGLDAHYEPEFLSLEDHYKRMKRYDEKSPRETFSGVIKDLFNGEIAKDVRSILKLIESKIKPHNRLNSILRVSPIFVGAIFPPYSHGYLTKTVIDSVNDYEKAKEIGKALEIGDVIERKINEGLSEREVETYLNSFQH